MTHTLHRRGSEEDLKHEYLVFALAAKGINWDGSEARFKRAFQICLKYHPLNYGNTYTGNIYNATAEAVADGMKPNAGFIALFDNEQAVVEILKELKQENLGQCIVVSGLFDHVHQCCRNAGLEPHTVNISGGIRGRTDKLAPEPILEINTMCGHALVSFNLIKKMVEEIRAGGITALDAAKKMALNCHCGMFNCDRAARILTSLATENQTAGAAAS